jgi:ATP-dependent Lhr-like helicase
LDPLSVFTPDTRAWFEASFATPTPAQAKAWPAIAAGGNVLLSAPTGSGKTLAAFLLALDRLAAQPARTGTRLVYVSPLKALSYDIERNLRVPLRGIGAQLSVAIRTGDTSQRERAAMARKPPDILITTPESLYLILGSRAREMLTTAECVIVDEIHAVAAVKRGAHLALTLERLQEQAGGELQRIGLSATQSPLEEIGRFLVGPSREVEILDAAADKRLDLRIEVPVESMAEPGQGESGHAGPDQAGPGQAGPGLAGPGQAGPGRTGPGHAGPGHAGPGLAGPRLDRDQGEPGARAADPLAPLAGGEATKGSIWPAIYPEVLRLVREHRSTIVFVNNRRSAERVALRLNEMAEEEIARAHHGSLAREERETVEELLKAGKLPCLIATSSLELGIDMGAVDLVLQIESPKSVARGLQRIGRAGHSVGEVSKGRIFPKFRGDLLECTVVCRRMREGAIEQTVVPRNALDVLAQQIVAIAASADGPGGAGRAVSANDPGASGAVSADGRDLAGRGDSDGDEGVDVEALYEMVRRTYSYSELPRALFENVLDMLDGRYPSHEFGELRPRIAWDRLAGRIRARRGARQLAVTNAGTIPDRGLYSVTLPDGRRVGELDEEMVYEARPGQVFLLGASSWRIEEIGRDRVIVTPAPGVPGAVPFWKGEGVGRPKELGAAIGAFSRWAVDRDVETLVGDYDLDERAARNLLEYLREQQQATGVLPSDRTIVLERFRDEIGDWRLCVLSPYGGRVHAAWSLAISARIRQRFDIDGEAIFSDDGIVVRLPDVDFDQDDPRPSDAELVALDPEDVEELIVGELGGSALFGARFRENAGRALLIPRAYPGRRTPLWQQRLKAQGLLEVARRHADFPIVLETYRECLRDVLDVPGLVELLRGLATREVGLVEVETQSASPFASSLLFDYVASYMYEGDTPGAERRAAALSLDRDLLRELLGMEDLRELIDPEALARVEDDLQHRSPHTRAHDADSLYEVLRRVGDLHAGALAERVTEGVDATLLVERLVAERRAIAIRLAGEERLVAADDAGLYRDALGAAPPGGLPAAFLEAVPDALRILLLRHARTNGPFTDEELFVRYPVDGSAALRELERAGELVRGELRPGGAGREWCHVEVLRRLRRASLAALRREIEPVDAHGLARFLPSWQGVDRSTSAGVDRLREVLISLQGLALPVKAWERDVLPRRIGAYSPAWLDSLCASGEVIWAGAGPLGRDSGRVALYFREDAPLLGPPVAPSGNRGEPPAGKEHEPLRERLVAGPCFFTDLLADLDLPAAALAQALWDLVWAGEATNDAWAPLRAPRLTAVPRKRGFRGGGPSTLRGGRAAASGPLQGRWSATRSLFAADAAADPQRRRRALAELMLERYGLVTREQVLAEGVPGGFAMLYSAFAELETLGLCRRGYFVEGLGGAQFALPGAVERLRASSSEEQQDALVLAAVDPAQPYGASLPWPPREPGVRRPARVDGSYVVLVDTRPALYLERGGRALITLTDHRASLERASRALADAVRAGALGRVALERVDGGPVGDWALEPLLVELGFRAGPRRLTLTA